MEDYKNLAMLATKERYEQQLDDTRWKLKANKRSEGQVIDLFP